MLKLKNHFCSSALSGKCPKARTCKHGHSHLWEESCEESFCIWVRPWVSCKVLTKKDAEAWDLVLKLN